MNEVFQQQPELEAAEDLWAAYDPWEAVEVAWDGKSGSYAGAHAVCGTNTCEGNASSAHPGCARKTHLAWQMLAWGFLTLCGSLDKLYGIKRIRLSGFCPVKFRQCRVQASWSA